MGYISINQSNDFEETIEVVKKYIRMGHSVQIKLQEFHQDTLEHKSLEWEVWVDFDPYLCFNCKRMKDARIHPITEIYGQNYCNNCAKE